MENLICSICPFIRSFLFVCVVRLDEACVVCMNVPFHTVGPSSRMLFGCRRFLLWGRACMLMAITFNNNQKKTKLLITSTLFSSKHWVFYHNSAIQCGGLDSHENMFAVGILKMNQYSNVLRMISSYVPMSIVYVYTLVAT